LGLFGLPIVLRGTSSADQPPGCRCSCTVFAVL
jgi:hypothetical protein